ncbi:MAG: NADH-quinone oxidoreductase subunit J [Propionibacteriaceae bacterium]|nr:NADH-quinone oxidoreductase subunit J [Propionibacteriaceae bacterium]
MTLIPLITGDQVAFWVCAPIMVVLAIGMVIARRPVHSAICIAGVMVGLAVLYAAQDAPFLFVVQIIVYTGAILMLFLFVVMLVGIDSRDSFVETLKGHRITSLIAAFSFAALVILVVGGQVFDSMPTGLDAANAEHGGNLQGIATLLFTRYVFIFEATAALLITAAMGAMILAHGERLKARRSQVASYAERIDAYANDGVHPGPLPPSGVFARHNAIHVPALLPDGSISELSVSPTLRARGVIMEIEDLRRPTKKAFSAIEQAAAQAEGEEL